MGLESLAEVDAESLSECEHDQKRRLLSATAGSGAKRHRYVATPRGEKITRHGSG